MGYLALQLIALVLVFPLYFIHCLQDSLPNESKLAVVYLHSQKWEIDRIQILLFCSVAHMYANVAPNTPISVYIFHRQEPTPEVKQFVSKYPDLHLVFIPGEEWTIPAAILSRRKEWTTWWYGADANYRLMGYWRLTCPFDYVRQLGHKYLLFIDDDSYVQAPIKYNLLESLSSRNLSLAFRKLVADPIPSLSLAELVRYYITSNHITPTQLFEDCEPQNITGLYTSAKAQRGDKDTIGGWKATVMYGNFVIISIDFWFEPRVQSFLNLCLLTGDVIVHRWNEQLVIGMIRLLFVKKEEEILLDFPYEHKKHHDKCAMDL